MNFCKEIILEIHYEKDYQRTKELHYIKKFLEITISRLINIEFYFVKLGFKNFKSARKYTFLL